ncbi:hypothetical protein PV08_11473 [Exophiala spinifera]|uniref:Ada DNA repair metal-binding domain-containing protein n=1 Tax=Exophiala spinifera TaxID=91928 RepID=A0A0D2BGT0_9EURO|nr:uncharacterized protein PV08_11473 [Exophiala spinifera]KIW10509.1 hypothetical protein PV08_11473 [Exophiala spinifera]
MFDTDQRRWQAVQARSKHADLAFVYAVTTTKIFCRPTCPARLARRANVKFYDTPVQASLAGFRPCKRCKPDRNQVDGSTITQPQKEIVKKACEYIATTKGNTTLKDMAQNVNISSRYLHGIFKDIIGSTPAVYAAKIRSQNSSEAPSRDPTHALLVDYTSTTPPIDNACLQGDTDFAFGELNMNHYASVAAYEAVEEQLKRFDQEGNFLGWLPDEVVSVDMECSPDEFFDFSAYDNFLGADDFPNSTPGWMSPGLPSI